MGKEDDRFRIEEDDLANNPTKRCPCLLVLDTSSSMEGEPIQELNSGVQQFISEVQGDPIASASVELGVVTFNSVVKEVLEFTLIAEAEVPLLTTGGMTSMGAGVRKAIQLLRDRRQQYRDYGVGSYVPWLVLMTDGGPNDDWSGAAQQLRRLGEQKQLIVFGVGIGSGCDFDTLEKFCPPDRPPLHLTGLNFQPLFHFLSKSMEQVAAGATPDGGFALARSATNSDLTGDDDDDWST